MAIPIHSAETDERLFLESGFHSRVRRARARQAPLIGIVALAKIGLWPDPDPNPIGPGLLTFVTFWPGVLLMTIGARRVNTQRSRLGR